MADWHRAYADTTGSAHERDSRLRFADFLDRLAAEKDAKERIKETKQDPRFSKH
ncbi:MAG: hypothetical protein HY243_13390 [Proteobacteria bacterium]|nr:hypothetical protein [Pseudomonadota bacterium]